MNTYIYRVVLGCVVIICYLQQQGWAAPSQTQNGQPSIQQIQINDQLKEEISEDTINRVLLNLSNTLSRIQKRQVVSPAFEEFRQTMRNFFYPLFYCSAKILRRDMQVHYLDVSNTMHEYIRSYNSYISDCG